MFFIKSDEKSRMQTASPGRASVPTEESRTVGRMLTNNCTSEFDIKFNKRWVLLKDRPVN